MFKNWTNLFTIDCRVIEFNNETSVYPIFKNGQSSLFEHARKKKFKILKNEEILKIKNIKIFLRDPEERFVSGVHTVIELEKVKDVGVFLKNVENFKTYNRHFIPQFYWLIHLSKYYKGDVEILPVKKLYRLIANRNSPNIKKINRSRKKEILSIDNKKYVTVDHLLIQKYMGQKVNLQDIIKELKNAVS